jgi:DNA replication protein DnaC
LRIAETQQILRSLFLTEAATALAHLIEEAEKEQIGYIDFLQRLLQHEQKRREEKQIERRMKMATFPTMKTLDQLDLKEQQSLSKKQLNQLRELSWLERNYNIILLGPPGVGKTHLAIGLGIEAVRKGFKVAFTSMGNLIQSLNVQDVSRIARSRLKRIVESDLVLIDDLMFMAMNPREANLFFHLINQLYDKSSVILTSNKGPEQWGELLGDHGITTAILDRIIHRAEIISLCGDSFRLRHRSSIFGNEAEQKKFSKSVQL